MIVKMDVLDNLPDEDYVLQRAKLALKTDPLYAKAWMITAKCLYPDNFGVQVSLVLVNFRADNLTTRI